MLARALVNDPELLILDEPTTGLDPQSRHALWERLGELRRRGLTILLTTHYLEEAARLCKRLVILDRGRILVEGTEMLSFLPRRLIAADEVFRNLRAIETRFDWPAFEVFFAYRKAGALLPSTRLFIEALRSFAG